MKPLRNKPTYAEIMAAKKRADRYVARDGGAPSITKMKRDQRAQDLNNDDRKHLKFCFERLAIAVAHKAEAEACLEFVRAIVDHAYQIDDHETRRQDESNLVNPREDPDLYRYAMTKRQP